jgi:hypothetical protein
LEFPYSSKSAIYSNEKSLAEGIEILTGYGFTLMRVVPNGGGECNAFFRNVSISLQEYFQIEEDLNFRKAPTLKIGNHDSLINMSNIQRLVYFAKTRVFKIFSGLRINEKDRH